MNQKSAERPLPCNLDAERAILGAGILDNKAVMEAAAYITREDFFLEQHRLVFSACQVLAVERQPIDLVTLTDLLHREQKLEAAGGAAYISAITDGMPKVSNLPLRQDR